MALEITVGPPQLAINEGNVVLVTDPDDQIVFPSDKRRGVPWDLLNSGNITHYASRIFLTDGAIPTEDGEIPRRSIALSIGRSLGGGMHEDLDLANHGMGRNPFDSIWRSRFAAISRTSSKSRPSASFAEARSPRNGLPARLNKKLPTVTETSPVMSP